MHEHVKPAEHLGGVRVAPGAAAEVIGNQAVVELTSLVGYYATLLVDVGDAPGRRPREGERDRRADAARARDEGRAVPQSKPVRHSEQ